MKKRERGFTLIELMATVAIIAILAGIGVTVLQKFIYRGRVSEVSSMFYRIITKENSYYNEFGTYVSNGWAPVAPAAVSGQGSMKWPAPANIIVRGFEEIGFRPDKSTVWHIFRVTACKDVTQAPCSTLPCSSAPRNFPNLYTGPGFIIEAIGDVNNDGNQGHYCATSHSTVPILVTPDWPGQESAF
ncbi:MAG: prepilin-type N-terminal cleavage/methylation domain-containing protein [Deltaproteobacteria bacterium]|nr:prepilin-type N-terminal cleavage/methylation domain-containing protein [Deltaproteobacteria bacterium]